MHTAFSGIVDSHAHVFHRGLAFVPARRFTPDYDAPLQAYLDAMDANGVDKGVLVALSVLGTDNRYLLACLRTNPDRLRGVVAIDPAAHLADFDDFESAGVVGVRVNLTGGLPVPDFTTGAWAEAVAECVKRDWHIEINDRADRLHASLTPLTAAGVKIVVDHFGMPSRDSGTDDPGFTLLLEYGPSRRVWVKLSGAYRTSPAIAELAAARLLTAYGPQQLLWASDWPFTQHESVEDYATQRALIDCWIPDPQQRQTILCETPHALFKF
jgi:predicted TIM-barrel fold metal-dependent hydrolase